VVSPACRPHLSIAPAALLLPPASRGLDPLAELVGLGLVGCAELAEPVGLAELVLEGELGLGV
jgi:hypothetical protein